MHCTVCDKLLSDYESTLKHATYNYYIDTCVKCLKGLSIATVGRDDLLGEQEPAEGDVMTDEFEEEDFLFHDEDGSS